MMPFAVWPGPMEGVMHPAFVHAATELKLVDRWMTPFLRISNGVPRRRHLEAFLAPFRAADVPLTVQLMGVDPVPVAAVAAEMAELGACGINLNFGCPSRQVTSGGAGGGALRNPAKMAAMISAVRSALPETVPLSVKMRCAYASESEMPELMKCVVSCGVSQIFFHFRTVAEQYRPVSGGAGRIARAVELAEGVPVIGNGDINSVADAGETVKTGVAGVMCARGWLRDPGLLLRLQGTPDVPEPEAMRRKFFAAAVRFGLRRGQAMELSNFLWGAENPWFETIRALPADGVFELE